MCGDPNSVLRFAFIEFTDEGNLSSHNWSFLVLCSYSTVHWSINIPIAEGARAALNLSGTVLGYYPVRVLPSKTAIAPVNPTFLPRVSKPFGVQHIYLRLMVHTVIYCDFISKRFTSLMWSAVWWWTWNVCKDYLLHKHWQEGLLPYNYYISLYSFLLCLSFNMSTYYRSLRQIWNCSLSLYVERLVILYSKPLFSYVQFAYAKCHVEMTIWAARCSLAHCKYCFRSFGWGCLVTTIILLASPLWSL